MNKFFAKKIVDQEISFLDQDVNHILKVLKLTINSELIVNDTNKKYFCRIINLNPLRAQIIEELKIDLSKNYQLNVFFSTIKPTHLEIALIKAAELNVDNFYIFNSNYAQGNVKHNLNRYNSLITSACKQCNRIQLMNLKIIDKPKLHSLLIDNDLNLIANFSHQSPKISSLLNMSIKSIGVIIGPEGGFNENDIESLKSKNTYIINLTKTILRSETAMIYLVSIVDYLMNWR